MVIDRAHSYEDDSPFWVDYNTAMGAGSPFIRLKLNTEKPVEMGEFVGAFTAIADEYDTFVRKSRPNIDPTATLFVKEVKSGSVEAILIPMAIGALPFLENANALAEFVKNYGGILGSYVKPGGKVENATTSQLRNFGDQVAAIANEPGSSLEVAAIEIKNGKEVTRAAFKFRAAQAKQIRQNVDEHKRQLERGSAAQHSRVLMVFTRTDVSDAKLGKRSGERVLISSVSRRALPVIFASDMAEQRIRHEIREEEDNVYKKGFVVDVNVELSRSNRPAAYRITDLHGIIELPDDEEEEN